MKIIVNDANILIDLVELNLLPHFFDLKFEFHTTTFVLDELFEEQQEALQPYIDKDFLLVSEMSSEDLIQISQIQLSRPKLSEQDCSAFFQAQTEQGTLITSDNNLRKFAKEQNLEVHGHLWVFDRMVEAKTISPSLASKKLTELCKEVNPRLKLPAQECSIRHNVWKKN